MAFIADAANGRRPARAVGPLGSHPGGRGVARRALRRDEQSRQDGQGLGRGERPPHPDPVRTPRDPLRDGLLPRQPTLLTGSLDNTARLWDIASGKEIRRFTGHTAAVYAVDFTPDGHYAITGSADRSARVWDLTSPLEADTLEGQISFVYAVDFSPDGSRIFTGSADGTGRLWDATSRQVVAELYTDSRVDARRLLARWSIPPPRRTRTGRPSCGTSRPPPSSACWMARRAVITADFSADGRLMLATAALPTGDGGSVGRRVRRPPADIRLRVRQQRHPVPDGRYVAIGLDETKDNLPIFDAATGERLRVLDISLGPASTGIDVRARQPSRPDRQPRQRRAGSSTSRPARSRELIGHTNIIWGTAYSPDGRLALTGSQDRTARLWDVATGAEIRRFASHRYSAIAGVAFSADGKTIGIGNFDGFTQLTPTDLPALVSSTCARLLRDFGPSERLIYEIPDELATCAATTSISTRAPLGSAATADRRARRRRIADESAVDAVDRREIAHVDEEDGGLDDVVPGRARRRRGRPSGWP